jgi:HSP20 family protein
MPDIKSNKERESDQKSSESREMRPTRRQDSDDPFGFSLMPSEFFSTNPFSMMRRMHDEMDRMFAESFGRGAGQRSLASQGTGWMPAVEVSEREGNYIVCAELPGIKKDDVKIEVTDEALVIEGERKQEHEETKGGMRRSERSYGRFYRMIPLPDGANTEQAKASFQDGVLEVKIPIEQQKSRSRQIQIGERSSTPEQPAGSKK